MAGFEDDIAKEIADILRQHVAAATKPLKDRIAELERCVKEIELRGELKYLGTWREDQQYESRQFLHHERRYVTLRDAHSEQAGHRRTGQERWEMMPTKQAPKPTLIVHDLRRLETFISKRDDDYVALKLETSDEQNPEYWLRVHRSDFLNLAEYLAPVHLTLSSHR